MPGMSARAPTGYRGSAVRLCARVWNTLICVFSTPRPPPAARQYRTAIQFLENLEGVLPQAVDAALIVDESRAVLFATDRVCRLLKYDSKELDGQTVEGLMPEQFRLAYIGHRLGFTDDRRAQPMGASKSGSVSSLQRRLRAPGGYQCLNPIRRGSQTLVVVAIQVRALDSRTAARADQR